MQNRHRDSVARRSRIFVRRGCVGGSRADPERIRRPGVGQPGDSRRDADRRLGRPGVGRSRRWGLDNRCGGGRRRPPRTPPSRQAARTRRRAHTPRGLGRSRPGPAGKGTAVRPGQPAEAITVSSTNAQAIGLIGGNMLLLLLVLVGLVLTGRSLKARRGPVGEQSPLKAALQRPEEILRVPDFAESAMDNPHTPHVAKTTANSVHLRTEATREAPHPPIWRAAPRVVPRPSCSGRSRAEAGSCCARWSTSFCCARPSWRRSAA